MVAIGGFNLDIGNLFSFGGIVSPLFWSMVIFVTIGLFVWYMYNSYRNKAFYTNPITLTINYDNGTTKTRWGLKGGRFINRHGVNDFKIKIPKQFKKKELGYTPDFSLADSDGTLHFTTSGDNSIWQQTAWLMQTNERVTAENDNGEEVTYDSPLIMKPVRTDVKTVTVNAIKNWSEIVNKQKITLFSIGLGAFIIIAISHLISLYIQTKIKCGTP